MSVTRGCLFEAPQKIPGQLCESRSLKNDAKPNGSQSTSNLASCFHTRLIFAHQSQHQHQAAQVRLSTINYHNAFTMVSPSSFGVLQVLYNVSLIIFATLILQTVPTTKHCINHYHCPSPSLKPKLTFHLSSSRSATQPPRSNPPSPPAPAAPTSASPSKTPAKPPRRSTAGSCSAR